MSEIVDFGRLQIKTFRKFSEKISAIAYHKGKIAVALASSYQRIEVWNCNSNTCELTINTNGLVSRYLKFDDSIILSMFEEIRSWNLPSGKSNVVFKGGVFRCCSFDYYKEYNIVVGSFSDSSIYIWNFTTGEEVKRIVQEHCSVQKVSIHPVLLDEPQRWNTVHLLVLKDREIDMWTVKFNPSDMLNDEVTIDKNGTAHPFFNPFRRSPDSSKIGSFQFKEEFLYYLESSADTLSNKIIIWNMKINLLFRKIQVNRNVKNLLGIGDKYFAVQTETPSENENYFVIIDRMSETEVSVSQLPSELHGIGADGNPSVIIGDTSWLDGFNVENDQEIFCLCVSNRQTVHVLRWGETEEVIINESSGSCNLL